MVRKIEGVKVTGFYGRVVSTGKKTFEEVAKEAAGYINSIGGFYAFAEWGLIR
jgi:hypothetical protein